MAPLFKSLGYASFETTAVKALETDPWKNKLKACLTRQIIGKFGVSTSHLRGDRASQVVGEKRHAAAAQGAGGNVLQVEQLHTRSSTSLEKS